MTLAAVKALASVDDLFAPASTKNDFSLALDIIRPHLRHGVTVHRLDYPMTREDAVRQTARLHNARLVLDSLASGRDAAFITLGDPLIYSTFGHLLHGLRTHDATIKVRIIPGITSFQAASARLGEVLVEGDECLVVATGNTKPDKLERLLDTADAAVVLKPAKRLTFLTMVLERLGLARKARLMVRCGLPEEQIITDFSQIAGPVSYFSLLHVIRNRDRNRHSGSS